MYRKLLGASAARLRRLVTGAGAKVSSSATWHLHSVLSINGYLSRDEAELLFRMASRVSSGCIVEIGSYQGKSTVALALGVKERPSVPVYAIDPHESFEGILGGTFGPKDRVEFFKNMLRSEVAEIVRLVNLPSEVAAQGWHVPVSLLWIDGDHRYESVRSDFAQWSPHISERGIVAFHDSVPADSGPGRVIEEVLASGQFERVESVDLTTVLKKR